MSIELNIPEIICTGEVVSAEKNTTTVSAKTARPIRACPYCHQDQAPHKHSVTHHFLRDISVDGKQVVIDLMIQRYRCSACNRISQDTFAFYEPHSRLTNRLKHQFVKQYLAGKSFSAIAREHGMDRKTVTAICRKYTGGDKKC